MLSRIIPRFLLLCGLTALFIAALAVYVAWMQPKPSSEDALSATVEKAIFWPWEWRDGAALAMRFRPPPEERADPKPVRELTLVLDTSASMAGAPLEEAKRAALEFLDNLDMERRGGKVHIVQFESGAKEMTPPEATPEAARKVLNALSSDAGLGGGTAFLPALEKTLETLRGATGATVALLTDGEAESAATLRDYFERTWRPSGHELFLLGIGDSANRENLAALTDDPDTYVITGLDRSSPAALFQQTGEKMRTRLGRAVRLNVSWSAPLVENAAIGEREACEPLPATPPGDAIHALPALFARAEPYCWRAGFQPRLGGVLRVLHEPLKLEYIDSQNRLRSLRAATAYPIALAIPWWVLFPALLYLLAEWFAHLFRPKIGYQPSPAPTALPSPSPPARLARRRIDPHLRVEWLPTLLIGLGGGGRQVLTHVAQALRDACYEAGEEPLPLVLDVARDELTESGAEAIPGCLENLPAKSVFFLPETACRLQKQIADNDPNATLDLTPYRDWPTERLSLNRGTFGEGPLARRALLNDLAEGDNSALLERLRVALDAWRALSGGAAAQRQIILAGNAEGGITKGWLSDLLILLRRLTAEDEQAGVAVDLSVLLLGKPEVYETQCHPLRADRCALFDELDRLACAGRLPFRHGWADASFPLAEDWVEHRPQDALFVMSARREDWTRQLYPNAADALLLLADARRRGDLTGALESLRAEEERRRLNEGKEAYTEIELRSAGFPHSFPRRLIEARFLGLLLSDRVLFPGLDPEGANLPPGVAVALLEPSERAETPEESALFALASGVGGAPAVEDLSPELTQALCLRLQTEWTERLRTRRWNLATLACAAQIMAGNLRRGGQTLAPAALVLDDLANQAVEWIAVLLGSAVARRTADLAGISGAVLGASGLLPEIRKEYGAIRARYEEWRANPSRLSVLPWREGSDDSLLQGWLRTWLGVAVDPNLALQTRCRFVLAVPGHSSQGLGLALDFTGTRSERFAPNQWPEFLARVRGEVTESLWPDMRARFLEALEQTLGDDPRSAAIGFATRLKGDLRGDRATLLVSMPAREVAIGAATETLCRTLRESLEREAGPAEILKFHEARDPFRFLLWRLRTLREAQARQDNPHSPLHACERLRAEYGRHLAQALGQVDLRLPPAAGLALSDHERLVAFAGLWLAGMARRDASSGLWLLRDARGNDLALTHFPEEGLAEAAARFVAARMSAPPLAQVPEGDLSLSRSAAPFENLLRWLWRLRAGAC
jgi:uncharacterized protein YegL